MGSVVLDTVNSFWPSHHSNYAYPDAPHPRQASPPAPKRSRTPSLMSASRQRAPSSSATRSTTQPHVPSATDSTLRSVPPQQGATPQAPPLAPAASGAQPATQTQHAPSPAPAESRPPRPRKIKVRDLQHIQSFATEDMGAFSEIRGRSRSRSRGAEDDRPEYEISEMKVEHIIEMVAGLLTKITTTNDQQFESLHSQPARLEQASHLTSQTSSVLAFHGKNVPSITILSYLSRINKYCPTSYEVFLSLLVYFDRMAERVNAGPIQELREANQQAYEQNRSSTSSFMGSLGSEEMEGVTATTPQGTQTATPPASGSMEKGQQREVPGTPHSKPSQAESPSPDVGGIDAYNLSHFFAVDSFNIHRLVIAGVTCASKFFSDIFYTNSRYAKVCRSNDALMRSLS